MTAATTEIIARAIIRREGQLSPPANASNVGGSAGGHVEPSEGVEALVREISEEIGTEAKITEFVGVVEHGYREDGVTHHELNLGFEVAITEPDPDPNGAPPTP